MAVAHRLSRDVWPAWLDAARLPGDSARRGDLVGALGRVDAAPVRCWNDPAQFLEPIDESVCAAMYWQPPREEDVVAADPAVRAALRPVADAIAAAPGAAWWTAPVDRTSLRYTRRLDNEPATPPRLTGAAQRLEQWRADTAADERCAAVQRPADVRAPISGNWWSTPALALLVTTTRPLPGLGSIKLVWEEDSFGQKDAVIWPLRLTGEPRVWEIDGPDAWTALVDSYPLDVTHTRRHDWYRVTGRDGPWRIPDWSAVAADWDGVHLTVAGYLTTATRALPLADGVAATMLAGWDPDQTWWLTDVFGEDAPQPETWHDAAGRDDPPLSWRRIG